MLFVHKARAGHRNRGPKSPDVKLRVQEDLLKVRNRKLRAKPGLKGGEKGARGQFLSHGRVPCQVLFREGR